MFTVRPILRPWVAVAAVALCAAGARAQDLQVNGGGPLEIRSLKVETTIEAHVARTTVEEVFFNPTDRVAEGTWLLPLPEGAAVEKFSMWVDGAETAGELLDAGRARGIYESIVRQRRDPGLLEMVGNRLFRARVFPIPAREEKRVRLSFTEVLPGSAGTATWRFPLRMLGAAGRSVGRASISVTVATERPLTAAYSPTHAVEVLRKDDRHARVGWEAAGESPARDFVLVLQEPAGDLGFTFVASRPPAEEGSFLLVLSPAVDPEEEPLPRDVVLCLDTSGSMAGGKIEQAKGALRYAVRTLSPADRFSIVTFATEPRRFRESLVPATPVVVESALAFIDAIHVSGGTGIDQALESALGLLEGGEGERPAALIFLTDGLPTVGVTEPENILARAKRRAPERVRVFTFGVGNDVNTVLLDRMAEEMRGARDYVAPDEDIEVKVSALVDKSRYPVLAAPILEVEGVAVTAVYPRTLPDLFRGSELVVVGRYVAPGEATIRVRGRTARGERAFFRPVTFPGRADGAEFVDRLWAVRRVGHLADEMRLHGRSRELEDEVVRLARKHGIVTRYTSYLVVENEEMLRRTASVGRRPGGFDVADAGGGSGDPEIRPDVLETRPIDEQERVLEQPVLKDAEIGDMNETDDPRFDGDSPFRGQGTNADLGVGGGAGGMFGGRTGGHRNLRAEGGGGTEGAVEAGLEWLRRNRPAGEARDPGAVALGLLAYLGYGETHRTPRYGSLVRDGLQWLKAAQGEDGGFGPRDAPGFLRAHALAALAMAEAYGLTQSPLFKSSAQGGIDFLRDARAPYAGWGPGEGDLLTTAWAVMAMKSAAGAGLRVDPVALAEPAEWMGRTLAARDGAGSDVPPALRGAVLFARILAGADPGDPDVRDQAEILLAGLPAADDAEGWYFGTLAQFQVGGDPWRKWNEAMRGPVMAELEPGAEESGTSSVPPALPGEVACNTMTLEVYYRYARVFGASSGPRPKAPSRVPGPSGEDAVRRSLEAKRLAEAASAGEAAGEVPAGTVKEIAGRRFAFRDGAWWEDGIDPAAERRAVAPYSDDWFALAHGDAVLERCFRLGHVILRNGGEVIEVTE